MAAVGVLWDTDEIVHLGDKIMALLDENEILRRAEERTNSRLVAVTTKFSQPEFAAIELAAKRGKVSRGEFVRELVLRELVRNDTASITPPELTEIVGLRMLLTTVLKPLATGQQMSEATFDAIVLEVRRSKTEITADLLATSGAAK